MIYGYLANAVLGMHIAIVAFVVLGLLMIIVGNLLHWSWVNRPWFRLLHLATIAIVVAESWLGITCPLTTWEMWLREKADEVTYSGGFIEHWMQDLLYYDAPPWVFVLCYSFFGALVLASWWKYPPAFKSRSERSRLGQG